MTTLFGPDPVDAALQAMLAELASGRPPRREIKQVDYKEEAGRRDRHGVVTAPRSRNEEAAQQLASEAACMSNTEGGGALVVGVADDGSLVGAGLEAEWLRSRVYDLTQRLLTVDVREVTVRGVRLLVVRSPQAIEPIRWRNKISWRVDDRCVEVDAATWHARRMTLSRHDWSDESSHVDPGAARPEALRLARGYLRDSGEEAAADLAAASDLALLRRLNVITADGYLTNAGALAFVGRTEPALDYIRRDRRGGDSTARVREGGRGLVEELDQVTRTIDGHNGVRQVRRGLVVGRLRELPPLALREAIVNGIVHRDWATPAPTVVEHVGRTLVVTSPGGFVGGVTPDNIITHPSQARNRALAELFSSLRLAEREGIGVDRMVRDMLAVGYASPDIREVAGPSIRAALVGEGLDEPWIRFLSRLQPESARSDLSVLLLLHRLTTTRWVDVERAAPLLQLSPIEAAGMIRSLSEVLLDDRPLVATVQGVPSGDAGAWSLSPAAREALAAEDDEAGFHRPVPDRAEIALSWAKARGRISSTELASIAGAHPANVQGILKALEERGLLSPSRPNRRGAGFFYRFVSEPSKTQPR